MVYKGHSFPIPCQSISLVNPPEVGERDRHCLRSRRQRFQWAADTSVLCTKGTCSELLREAKLKYDGSFLRPYSPFTSDLLDLVFFANPGILLLILRGGPCKKGSLTFVGHTPEEGMSIGLVESVRLGLRHEN